MLEMINWRVQTFFLPHGFVVILLWEGCVICAVTRLLWLCANRKTNAHPPSAVLWSLTACKWSSCHHVVIIMLFVQTSGGWGWWGGTSCSQQLWVNYELLHAQSQKCGGQSSTMQAKYLQKWRKRGRKFDTGKKDKIFFFLLTWVVEGFRLPVK